LTWVTHGLLPAVAASAVLAAIHYSNLDIRIADHFYDAGSARWLGANTWWASTLLHDGGRWLMRIVALAALLCWTVNYWLGASQRLRDAAAYLAAAIVISTVLVGALKAVTNVDCPWDLARYGGHMPTLAWFAARPEGLPHAQCFPGAHSASGFSLVCLYFLPGPRHPRKRWVGLAIGVVVGGTFSFAQQARGAHFLSHDLTSAVLCWLVAVALHTRRRLPDERALYDTQHA
jgi:membrane-associated PAP2 superfamily phosphatase